MKILKNKYFIASAIIYLLVKGLRFIGHPLPILNGMINDLFCLPILLTLVLALQNFFFPKYCEAKLSLQKVLFMWIYMSIAFEVIMPLFSTRYTADWIDVPAYLAGGIFFYFFINPRKALNVSGTVPS
jgi:predicted membrane protein